MDQLTVSPSGSAYRRQQFRPPFWRVAQRCCQLAAMVDVAFFGLFLFLDSPILAWVNLVSVSMYVVAYMALSRHRNQLAITLIWSEVIIHAALGTLMIGWASGFHYFLLMFIPALFASMHPKAATRAVIGLWTFYVGLDLLMRWTGPLQPVSSQGLTVVHLFNLTVVFAMFSYLSYFYMQIVKEANRKLRRIATTDSLTQLYNRRHTGHLAEKQIARCQRKPEPLSFLLMDLDYFKQVNDQYGHDVGDQTLTHVSEVIVHAMRSQDFVGRWGGEEFLAVLPGTDEDQALQTAERVRAAVMSMPWRTSDGQILPVTISIGISRYQPEEPLSSVIARADKALYKSKDNGRNRVTLAVA